MKKERDIMLVVAEKEQDLTHLLIVLGVVFWVLFLVAAFYAR